MTDVAVNPEPVNAVVLDALRAFMARSNIRFMLLPREDDDDTAAPAPTKASTRKAPTRRVTKGTRARKAS